MWCNRTDHKKSDHSIQGQCSSSILRPSCICSRCLLQTDAAHHTMFNKRVSGAERSSDAFDTMPSSAGRAGAS